MNEVQRWDFDAPLWDQCTFIGRVKYYAWITDPRLNFVSTSCFHQAKHLRTLYLLGMEPAETNKQHLLFAKRLYENAYHPDNNEYTGKLGRMSFMAIGQALTLGPMMTYYRSTTAVVFWQWANQSFNAFVNYTNRNANSPLTEKQMALAYVSATAAACVTAIGFKKFLAKQASPLIQRYVPFAAVAAANCVNIPLMRQNEFLGGIDVFNDDGTKVGTSKIAAVKGISEVVLSRIIMCAPGMNIMPLIMKRMESRCWFRKNAWFHAPFQTLMVGGFLTAMVPIACGIFPQKCGLSTSMMERFEPEEYEKLKTHCKGKVPETVYFNKGL